jgi:hypothetical protein
VKITKRIEKIASASEEIFGENPGSLQFLHSVLAQCSLPYREPRMVAGDKAVEYRITNMLIGESQIYFGALITNPLDSPLFGPIHNYQYWCVRFP